MTAAIRFLDFCLLTPFLPRTSDLVIHNSQFPQLPTSARALPAPGHALRTTECGLLLPSPAFPLAFADFRMYRAFELRSLPGSGFGAHDAYGEGLEDHSLFRRASSPQAALHSAGWCEAIVRNPLRRERQPDGRFRYWGAIEELGGRILRVVTLEDGETILNAFPDRNFKV